MWGMARTLGYQGKETCLEVGDWTDLPPLKLLAEWACLALSTVLKRRGDVSHMNFLGTSESSSQRQGPSGY